MARGARPARHPRGRRRPSGRRVRPHGDHLRHAADARRGGPARGHDPLELGEDRRPVDRSGPPDRPALGADDAGDHRRRLAHHPLLGRVHGARPRLPALLRGDELLPLRDAPAGRGRQLLLPDRGLGPGRARVVPAHRLLLRAPVGRGRREEGLRGQRDRRRRHGARGVPAGARAGHPGLRPGVRRRARGPRPGHGRRHRRRAAAVRRRRGQERPDPAPHLAARRDGGPDPGLRPHPRGDDGHGRRLHDRALQRALRAGAPRRRHRRRGRRRDPADGRDDRPGAGGHQARPGLEHREPDRLHDHGRGARRVRRRDVPLPDPRLLQGAALPRRRHRDPRAGRRAEPRPDGRPALAPAAHARHGAGGLPGHRRHPALLRLLQQGRHPRDGDGRRRARQGPRRGRPDRRRADGLLHVPPVLPGLLGPGAGRRLRARPPQPELGHVGAGRAAGPARDGGRRPADPGLLVAALQGLARAHAPGRPGARGDHRRRVDRQPRQRRAGPRSHRPGLVGLRGRPGAAPAPGAPGRRRACPAHRPVPLRRGLRGGRRPARTRPRRRPHHRLRALRRPGRDGGDRPEPDRDRPRPAGGPERAGAGLRLRDGRGRRGRRRHLQPGDRSISGGAAIPGVPAERGRA